MKQQNNMLGWSQLSKRLVGFH